MFTRGSDDRIITRICGYLLDLDDINPVLKEWELKHGKEV